MKTIVTHLCTRLVLAAFVVVVLPSISLGSILAPSALDQIRLEADYILQTQYFGGSDAYGALNNVTGNPTWIVPGENAIAIMGLVKAGDVLGDSKYRQNANLAADYLVRMQDGDGGWYSQYSYGAPSADTKYLRHTAETMMAFYKLGYNPKRYNSMVKGAKFLLACQKKKNKGGLDDGLVSGGKRADGSYEGWRWTSDNAFAYQALQAAAEWAGIKRRKKQASTFEKAAQKILGGIETTLLADSGDHWHRAVDKYGSPVAAKADWIGYAPAMLDIPISDELLGLSADWITENLRQADGSVVWDDNDYSSRQSPGYSLQASLAWLDSGDFDLAEDALSWSESSGLWQDQPDKNGVSGGWIDWVEGGVTAQWWERFIDTSAYYIMAKAGGYDFGVGFGLAESSHAPEPSTCVILLTGSIGLILRKKRKAVYDRQQGGTK